MKTDHSRVDVPPIPSNEVQQAILSCLSDSDDPMASRMMDPNTGSDYRGYLIDAVLEPTDAYKAARERGERHSVTPEPLISPDGVAKIYSHYNLTGSENGKDWLQLHGHVVVTAAAAMTIANRMLAAGVNLNPHVVVTAALLHDTAKGKEIAAHGALASSLINADSMLSGIIRETMNDEGVTYDLIEGVVTAATNTGRQDREFDSEAERRASIEAKGVEAAIVGLADARTIHMDFLPLKAAQTHYLNRKRDAESQRFFRGQWLSYYQTVSEYLTTMTPDLDLDQIDTEIIHAETIIPTTRGIDSIAPAERVTSKAEFDPNFSVTALIQGKKPPRSEDKIAIGDGFLALSDGATDKTGLRFEEDHESGTYKTGGEIAASIAVEIASSSMQTGSALVQEISDAMRSYYAEHNREALADSAYRFATTLVAARIVNNELIVTQVGDSSFRINGEVIYANDKLVDQIHARERIAEIQRLADQRPDGVPTEADITAGRAAILEKLETQHLLQNNAKDQLGYGILDGTTVPEKFIQVYSFSLDDIETIELVSDGYYGKFPDESTTLAWETIHKYQLDTDPYNVSEFPSTKGSTNGNPGDDRSVIIAQRISH